MNKKSLDTKQKNNPAIGEDDDKEIITFINNRKEENSALKKILNNLSTSPAQNQKNKKEK